MGDSSELMPAPLRVLDSINDGVYVTTRDRQIVYWNPSAERITGWTAQDVMGNYCHAGILCHEDKDGHRLCGEESCPLHRAITSGNASDSPIVLFAQCKQGGFVPLRVSVAPVLSESGEIIGGVETFRDLSEEIHDFERARTIQSLAMAEDVPDDARIHFRTHYIPRDVVGGDYHAIGQLGPDSFGFLLADVCGHGVSAALYTMYIRLLWDAHKHLLTRPAEFAAAIGKALGALLEEAEPFAAAICGVVDLKGGVMRLAGAGNPPPLLLGAEGGCRAIDCPGLPLGLFEDAQYTETTVEFKPGDCLLAFTDGAVEVGCGNGRYLGQAGLEECLRKLGYPRADVPLAAIEEQLLKASDRIRFDDDLTFMEIRR
jgi:PAS domain S-box-containing protein